MTTTNESNQNGQPLGVASTEGLGLVDRMRRNAARWLATEAHTLEAHNLLDEAADKIDRLRADLIACRGSVKTDFNFYSRAADTVQHTGSTAPAGYHAEEAQRLRDLLDRIDAEVARRDRA